MPAFRCVWQRTRGTAVLVRYEQARTALAECHRVDEVKDIRDKAEAMAAYARQAKDSELIQYATEIKVRAERRCGELLTRTAESGERASRGKPAETSQASTLSEMGLTRDESSRYQQLAAMPEAHFETAVATAKATAGECLCDAGHPQWQASRDRPDQDPHDRVMTRCGLASAVRRWLEIEHPPGRRARLLVEDHRADGRHAQSAAPGLRTALPKAPSCVAVFVSWQALQSACQLLSSQKSAWSPLCGRLWSTSSAAAVSPRLAWPAHSGCACRNALRAFCQAYV